ncbi:MAG: hypothetical protein R2726_12435 [Acidimicrobiales bacterium]
MLRNRYTTAGEGRFAVLDAETVELLHSGCALVVGAATPDGEPYAARAWGLELLGGGERGRLLLDADDARARELLGPGAQIAVTGVDVPTLRGVQLKGTTVGFEPVSTADPARFERYTEEFIDDVVRTEGTPRHLLERLVPVELTVCVFDVAEHFDQTPGPSAGASLGALR